jgi:hypothetical protein
MTSRAPRLRRLITPRSAVALALITAALAAYPTSGIASGKQKFFYESSSMVVTKSRGSNIEARGRVTGTLNGAITIHFTIINFSRTVNSFTGSAGGSSLSGNGYSNYYVTGAISHFTGKMAITAGKGKYAAIRATGLKETGTMNRSAGTIKLSISGWIN